tara:strand:+ start:568 stop:753 length:186 start_codon:yes stop_codon:yes gene_type:complete
MPLWLRKFTFKKLQEHFNAKEEASKSKSSNNSIDLANPNKSKIPTKRTVSPPSYVAKTSRK